MMFQKFGRMLLATTAWGSLSLFVLWVTFVRFTTDHNEYPALLAACQQASAADREKMNVVVKEAASASSTFGFTRNEREIFLKAGGYCFESSVVTGCKLLPKGIEGVGGAIEIFGHGRCEWPPDVPNICKPTVPGQRC